MSWFVLPLLLGSVSVWAGDAEEAEVTFQLGTRAYIAQDWERALAFFLTSNRLAPNPSVAFNIARCYARTEHYAEAYRWFSLAGEGLANPQILTAVKQEVAEITPRVVIFDVTSVPPGAIVYVDRKELGAIGTTPFKIALVPSNEPRRFIFEKVGYEDQSLEGIRGGKGSTIEVGGVLKQVAGLIDVHAPDGTSVRQGAPDGLELCVAPCKAKLPPGNWVLYFRLDGHRDSVRQLQVTADQTVTTLVEMTPNTGSVVVDATERGALVEIDGKAVGFTPTVVQGVPVGERLVRVSRVGYQSIERSIVIETDRQISLDDLEMLPLDEVTAVSRRAERLEYAPSSVTVISREELEAFRYPTIYEALRGVRGFALTYDSIYGNASVRGLGQANDYNTRLLLLQDGAVLNDNVLNQAFISYDGRVDLGGIERIEIVRGPGSVLYGTGAVSGVVNLVTDSNDAPEGTEVAVGTTDNRVLLGRVASHYKFGDKLGFRAQFSGATSQGRTETLDPRGRPQELVELDSFDKFDGATTHGRLWLDDLTLQWFHTWRDITIPTGAFFAKINDPNHSWTDARTLGEIRYEPSLSRSVTLLSRAYFNRYRYEGLLPYGQTSSFEIYLGLSTGAEARVQIEAGERFRLTLGGLGEYSPLAKLTGEDQDLDGTVVGEYLDNGSPDYTVGAGYALLDLVPVDAFRLTMGGRLDYWSTVGEPSFSPRLALVLLPDEGDTVKLLFGRAFRAPTIYEVSFETTVQALALDLKPEKVWSGEVEYTHAFTKSWSGLLSAHGSLAQGIIETVAASSLGPVPPQYEPNAITYLNSDADIRIGGIDAELRRSFQGGLMVSTFGSVLDSRYADTNEIVPNVPQSSAGLKLVVPIAAPIARLAFRSAYEAPRRVSRDLDLSTQWALVSDVVFSGFVPELAFEYGFGVYNLFNMAYALPAGDQFPLLVMPQQGRSLMANLSMRF